jgi:hypothetical protein
VLQRRGLTVAAVVVNETAASTVPLADTVLTLSRFAGPIVQLRRHPAGVIDQTALGKVAALL